MRLIFSTSQGDFQLQNWTYEQSLFEICKHNMIPFNSVSFYAQEDNGISKKIVGAFESINSKEFSNYESIIIKPNRNINYFSLLNKDIVVNKVDNPIVEYLFSDPNKPKRNYNFEFSIEGCKSFVREKVNNFLEIRYTISA